MIIYIWYLDIYYFFEYIYIYFLNRITENTKKNTKFDIMTNHEVIDRATMLFFKKE